ncbi:transporter substrate-binding domain-containing protein (plasmid) [Mesorhizobium sp. ORM8.1]
MKIYKLLAAAGLLLSALVAPALALPSSITIATEASYPPWNFTKPDGKLGGFEIELADELCKRMGLQCTMVAQDWDGIIPGLVAGKYDAIMSGINATPKRRQVIDFSRAYAFYPGGFGSVKDGPLSKIDTGKLFDLVKDKDAALKEIGELKSALKGKTIGVQVSTIHEDFLKKYLADSATIRSYSKPEEYNLDLLSGRLDAIFASVGGLRDTFGKPDYKNYAVVGPLFSGDVIGDGSSVALRKGEPELKAAWDKAINDMLDDGSLKNLSIKWFKEDITPSR